MVNRYLEDEASLEKTIEGGLGGHYEGVQINSGCSDIFYSPTERCRFHHVIKQDDVKRQGNM